MDTEQRKIYELTMLVDAQKKKLNALGKRVEVAHRQRLKSVSSKTMLKTLWRRLIKR